VKSQNSETAAALVMRSRGVAGASLAPRQRPARVRRSPMPIKIDECRYGSGNQLSTAPVTLTKDDTQQAAQRERYSYSTVLYQRKYAKKITLYFFQKCRQLVPCDFDVSINLDKK